MYSFFQNSLRRRLLASFISVGLIPFLLLLFYTLYLSETKIVNKLIFEQHEKSEVMIKRINSHLEHLRKEVSFLNSLDMMDDLLADDIDKRISRLLSKKAEDLNLDLVFMTLNKNSEVIASSQSDYLHKALSLKRDNKSLHGSYIEENYLYIYTTIKASFNHNRELGTLLLKYNLNNLDQFLVHNKGVTTYLVSPSKETVIGDQQTFDINFNDSDKSFIDTQHLVVFETLHAPLKEWHMVYAVEKSIALGFLYDFIRFMFYIAPLIFALIVYLSIRYANSIVRPIEELTVITDQITNTHNYTTRLHVHSQDEIAILAHSFNMMLTTTSEALQKLEEENRVRLQRFTQLIELFNTIIQTKTQEECIEVSLQELKSLTRQKSIYFQKEATMGGTIASTPLYITDFERETKIYFGTIVLEAKHFEDHFEKEFYHSIGSMISLQLDRIRLIKRALSASKAKSAFISNMSHELRTPLNSIMGSSQYLLVYESLSDTQQDAVGNIETSAQYLLGMINEILDIAKIEAGKMDPQMQEIHLPTLLQNSCDMLSPLAEDKALQLHLDTSDFELERYTTDPKMLSQIIINLISNAIKFTPKGTVCMRLYHQENTLFITVKDSGIGITKENIKQLFNDFTQIDHDLQKSLKGTGLGLSISKKLAEILEGDLTLESDGLEEGTTAILSLPLNTVAPLRMN